MVLGLRRRPAPPPALPEKASSAEPPWHFVLTAAAGLSAAAQRAFEHQLARLPRSLQPKLATTLIADLRSTKSGDAHLGLGLSTKVLLARATACERAFDLAGAARYYTAAISGAESAWLGREEGIEAVLRLAKQHSDEGWMCWAFKRGLPGCPTAKPPPSEDLARGRASTQYALALAEEALALSPTSSRCWTAVAVFSGRLALYSEEPRRRVALANRIRSAAERALVLNPDCDGAVRPLRQPRVCAQQCR